MCDFGTKSRVGGFGTRSRVEGGGGEGRNVTVIDIDHFYSLAVESGFYGDTGRVISFFTKLSNGDAVSPWIAFLRS